MWTMAWSIALMYQLGPCAMMDLVGVDIVVFVLGILEEEFGPKFKAAPLLKQMVTPVIWGARLGRAFISIKDGLLKRG